MEQLTDAKLSIVKDYSKQVELYKVLNGYLIEGKCEDIKDRLQVGDMFEYSGSVENRMELLNLFKKVKETHQIKETNDKVRFENEIVSFIFIVNGPNGKGYESKQIRMSTSSFENMIDSVQKMINDHNLDTYDKMNDYLKTLDPASDEYKSLSTYKSMYEDHKFGFILYSYNVFLGDFSNTCRFWYAYDFNDEYLRAKYAMFTECRIML
jgi:hypothetical protein